MSPIGSGKPLFDLIPNGKRAEVDHRPAGSQDPPPHPPPDDEPRRSPMQVSGELSVRVVWLYGAAAAALLLLIVVYGLGYNLGVSAERERWREQASREAGEVFVEDPLTGERPSGPSGSPTRQSDGGEAARAEATRGPAGGILTPTGVVTRDPRIEGNNYLELASLQREPAEQAVRYLASQGIAAIAVPQAGLDRRGGGRNTSALYRVISTELAVPSGQFSASRVDRERLEARVKRAGKAWAEMGGASDFSDPLWRRYGG